MSTKRIKVESGYTVPDRYITLEEGEELCQECQGTGKVVIRYTMDSHETGPCFTCGGSGKQLRCSKCGQLQPRGRISHKEESKCEWMSGMCVDCIMSDARFPR